MSEASNSSVAMAPFVVNTEDPLWAKFLYENIRDASAIYEANPQPPQPGGSGPEVA